MGHYIFCLSILICEMEKILKMSGQNELKKKHFPSPQPVSYGPPKT